MRVAILDTSGSSIGRDIDFSRGVFTADGLGELSAADLRVLDASGQLAWASDDVRGLVLGYSLESAIAAIGNADVADAQLQLDVETEVVYVPPHRMGSKTEAELKLIVADMVENGWVLVEDSRVGSAGGHLTFQRAEPLDPALLASLTLAG